jgi:hypothetical protein
MWVVLSLERRVGITRCIKRIVVSWLLMPILGLTLRVIKLALILLVRLLLVLLIRVGLLGVCSFLLPVLLTGGPWSLLLVWLLVLLTRVSLLSILLITLQLSSALLIGPRLLSSCLLGWLARHLLLVCVVSVVRVRCG